MQDNAPSHAPTAGLLYDRIMTLPPSSPDSNPNTQLNPNKKWALLKCEIYSKGRQAHLFEKHLGSCGCIFSET